MFIAMQIGRTASTTLIFNMSTLAAHLATYMYRHVAAPRNTDAEHAHLPAVRHAQGDRDNHQYVD